MHKKLSILLSQTNCKKIQIMCLNSNTSMDITQLTNLPIKQLFLFQINSLSIQQQLYQQLHMQILSMVENNSKNIDVMKIMDTLKIFSKGFQKASQNELELSYKDCQLQKAQQLFSGQIKNFKSKLMNRIIKINQIIFNFNYKLNQVVIYIINQLIKNKGQKSYQKVISKMNLIIHLKNIFIGKYDMKLFGFFQYQNVKDKKENYNWKIRKYFDQLNNINHFNNQQDRAEWIQQDDKQNDPTKIIILYQVCNNLEHRINDLKLEFDDIQEQGTPVFTQKLMESTQKQIKEFIQLVNFLIFIIQKLFRKTYIMLKQ
ncbi:unnamed protein product [Paramecium pentaurelia]|uniref:Uncharacterized protein n=1 Tax=Paramecium pentaurelia TaxID=43138 RepID=A0A8S1TAA3_9CILI|nr:unnamed protein product [Paramecium pentaurelia]